MALGAGFIQAGHGQTGSRFHDVQSMRIVALNAVHLALGDWMMLGKTELNANFRVAPKTGLGVLARIDDKLLAPGAANGDMFARRAMTRLATALPWHLRV